MKVRSVVAPLWRSGFLQNFRCVVTNDQMFNKGGGLYKKREKAGITKRDIFFLNNLKQPIKK